MFKQANPWIFAVAAIVLPGASWAQGHGMNVKDMKFTTMPVLPGCATAAVPQGDPAKGPAFILAKIGTNCVVPWHWHTANESVMLVSGEGRLDIKDGKSVTLAPAGFAMLPSEHIHRFTCLQACTLYIHSDAIFDIHYVNADGQEIAADEALKKKP
jgi:quercetin dioxygenase-like cupin family protein